MEANKGRDAKYTSVPFINDYIRPIVPPVMSEDQLRAWQSEIMKRMEELQKQQVPIDLTSSQETKSDD